MINEDLTFKIYVEKNINKHNLKFNSIRNHTNIDELISYWIGLIENVIQNDVLNDIIINIESYILFMIL